MKIRLCIRINLIFIILFLLCANFMIFSVNSSKRIIGYYISWGMYEQHKSYMPTDIPWTKLTHINYAFAEMKYQNGKWRIQSTDPWADHEVNGNGQIGMINELKRKYGVKTLISVGGWTRSGRFSEMARTDKGRTSFAEDCVRFIRQYKFDGVDIDWEYPGYVRKPDPSMKGDEGCPGRPEDKKNFTLLLQKLREVLDRAGSQDKKKYYLTIAAPGAYDKIEGPTGGQEPDKYHQYLDWINIMTYDFHGGWDNITAHHTALYSSPKDPFITSPINIKKMYNSNAIIKYFKDKYRIPASKINLGAAFYALSWKNVKSGNTGGLFQNGKGRSKNEGGWEYGSEGFYTIKQWETNSNYIYYYDNNAKAPYLYDKRGNFYTYDDEISIAEKCDYVIKNNYGGIVFWEVTGDYPAKGGDLLTSIIYNKFSNLKGKEFFNNKITSKLKVDFSINKNQLTLINKTIFSVKGNLYKVNDNKNYSFTLDKKNRSWQKKLDPGIYYIDLSKPNERIKFIIK